MLVKRTNCFETNSSSTHALTCSFNVVEDTIRTIYNILKESDLKHAADKIDIMNRCSEILLACKNIDKMDDDGINHEFSKYYPIGEYIVDRLETICNITLEQNTEIHDMVKNMINFAWEWDLDPRTWQQTKDSMND